MEWGDFNPFQLKALLFSHFIVNPRAPQTAHFVYGLGVSAASPDLPVVQMMNFTLGSGFASGIDMNLREAHEYLRRPLNLHQLSLRRTLPCRRLYPR